MFTDPLQFMNWKETQNFMIWCEAVSRLRSEDNFDIKYVNKMVSH